MSDLKSRVKAFVKLGDFLGKFCEYADGVNPKQDALSTFFMELDEVITLSGHKNGWFTKENILHSLKSWSIVLTDNNMTDWLDNYTIEVNKEKTIAIIMAGNIPMVGFHDILSVLVTGNKALVKLSSNDTVLLPFMLKYLTKMDTYFKDKLMFTDEKLTEYDAVIATGSDNTARYFEYYFGKKPNIIRKNRNSVAVLTGEETMEQLEALGEDIFRYYGLGCRSVSKLFVPKGYDFELFFTSIYKYNTIINQPKYANNYDYNKAVYLMSEFKLLDNGFLMLKEDESYSSPIASLFYEEYTSLDILKNKLKHDAEKLQCIVSKGVSENEIDFGKTQSPALSDYADGVDTVEFLLKI
ncbi:acyl-CoA reductase [Costertonia aggregata]|uniref:Acyl-CoA reductase n=1 Tax=Costertonia aggregata TaxID=343403 RepID=A0A7H9AVG8_9FLAO|nr:acyl-CoA reductase [Costertonia aggregata]QLG47085.1 acyl-CoA reductase [Costertonia aggregata]